MESINSTEAARSFGEVVIRVQQEPICIKKSGKPAAVMMSMKEYESIQALRQQMLHQRLDQALADVNNGRVRDGKEVHAELRQRLLNG